VKTLNCHRIVKAGIADTSVSHNMHHKYSVKNYGLWTTIGDIAFGTLHEKYEETYLEVTDKS
jgi:Delta7-sterol 5-desaturase